MTNDMSVQNPNKGLSRLEDSLFSPANTAHYSGLAKSLANSSVIPKQFIGKPTDIFVAMAMGYQLGMPVEQAIQDIAVINGRPCLWGDGMLAIVMSHPQFIDIIEEPIVSSETVTGYQCTIKRLHRTPTVRIYTLAMAKKAGLLGKQGPWTTSTDRMLQMRARGFAVRDSFPDALRGIRSAEEVIDYVDGEYQVQIDDKVSRTQNLKQDIMAKQGVNDDSSNSQMVVENSAKDDMQETRQQESSITTMDPSGEQEASNNDETVPVGQATESQLILIKSLMKDKAFTAPQLAKALMYYEADSLENLPADLADHFIQQLEKK